MRGDVPSLPQYAFMAWCSVKDRDNFTFLPLPFILTSTFNNGMRACKVLKREENFCQF